MKNIIIPTPINVFKIEKHGIGAISKGRINIDIDSGIVLKFDRNDVKPITESFGFEKLPIAFNRIQYHNTPETR